MKLEFVQYGVLKSNGTRSLLSFNQLLSYSQAVYIVTTLQGLLIDFYSDKWYDSSNVSELETLFTNPGLLKMKLEFDEYEKEDRYGDRP